MGGNLKERDHLNTIDQTRGKSRAEENRKNRDVILTRFTREKSRAEENRKNRDLTLTRRGVFFEVLSFNFLLFFYI